MLLCTVAKEKCKQKEFARFYLGQWKVCPLGKYSQPLVELPLLSGAPHGTAGTSPATGRVFCTVSKSHTCKAATAQLTFRLVENWIPGWLHARWVSLPEAVRAFGMRETTSLSVLARLFATISKLSEKPWLLIRSLSPQTSSSASDSFLFQPMYLL